MMCAECMRLGHPCFHHEKIIRYQERERLILKLELALGIGVAEMRISG